MFIELWAGFWAVGVGVDGVLEEVGGGGPAVSKRFSRLGDVNSQ
jgi:hypothetical protein